MGEISKVNDIDIWWEEYGEKSNPTVLLIMGANANCMQWPDALIEELVANDMHVVRFDNRDVGKSTWFNKEPFVSKVAKLLPLSISSKLVNYAFSTMTDDDGNFTAAEGSVILQTVADVVTLTTKKSPFAAAATCFPSGEKAAS